MAVLALIGDVVASRSVPDRGALQRQLAIVLEEVNRENAALVSPYTITLGGEFQAVYRNADLLFENMWAILLQMYPHKIRICVGLGELTTPINPKQAIGMDGPAFHNARTGIQRLKSGRSLFTIVGDNIPHLNLLNQSLNLISHVSNGWEKNRFQILKGMLNGLPAKGIADSLGISTVAVYKNINAGALQVIIELGNEIAAVLNKVIESS